MGLFTNGLHVRRRYLPRAHSTRARMVTLTALSVLQLKAGIGELTAECAKEHTNGTPLVDSAH